MEKWKCGKCNYVFVGKNKPPKCPHCGSVSGFVMIDEMIPFINYYDE